MLSLLSSGRQNNLMNALVRSPPRVDAISSQKNALLHHQWQDEY